MSQAEQNGDKGGAVEKPSGGMRIGRESINPKNKETGNGCCKTWEYTNIVYFAKFEILF